MPPPAAAAASPRYASPRAAGGSGSGSGSSSKGGLRTRAAAGAAAAPSLPTRGAAPSASSKWLGDAAPLASPAPAAASVRSPGSLLRAAPPRLLRPPGVPVVLRGGKPSSGAPRSEGVAAAANLDEAPQSSSIASPSAGASASPLPPAAATVPSSAGAAVATNVGPLADWASLLPPGLPLVDAAQASAPGFALGLPAARRHHLALSPRMGRVDALPVDRVCSHHHAPAPPSPPPLVTLAAGDVLLALNGVPTMGGEEESLGALAHKLLRLCYKTGTWVTVARPVGRVRGVGPAAAQGAAEGGGTPALPVVGAGSRGGSTWESPPAAAPVAADAASLPATIAGLPLVLF